MASTADDTEVTEAIASLSLKVQEEQEEHRLEEERLSSDLATFLSNPSLKAALADGSLKLDQYSVTVEQELHELASNECDNKCSSIKTKDSPMMTWDGIH
jgi:hypothetical protein